MSATAIELTWSAPEGAADYQVHRVPRTSDDKPEASVMTAENRIHSGDERGLVLDSEVTAGSSYWYGVRGLDSDGSVLSSGWHRADAVTDEEPPSPVEVAMNVENGEVLLTWSAPDENYQLHAYRILRGVDGGELEVVGNTWNLAQTSFLDDDPPDGLVTYAVAALDFHWNLSEPEGVTVELP